MPLDSTIALAGLVSTIVLSIGGGAVGWAFAINKKLAQIAAKLDAVVETIQTERRDRDRLRAAHDRCANQLHELEVRLVKLEAAA